MIRLVEVKGYKCLRYIRQPLRPFHILVGPNASGKSTFLDVVLFPLDLVENDVERAVRSRARTLQELVWKGKDNDFEISLEFELPKVLQSQRNDHTYRAIRYEIRVGIDENKEIRILVENLWLISEAKAHPPTQQLELFPQYRTPPKSIVVEPEKHAPQGWRKVMSRSKEGRVYVRSERTDWNMPLKPLAGRSGLTIIPEEEERFPAAVWLRRPLSEGIQFLMLDSRSMRAPPGCPTDFPAHRRQPGPGAGSAPRGESPEFSTLAPASENGTDGLG
ncbi:MAG: AAA family ATPase [Candidatus Oleimicrobiaceae bacterium]